MTEIWALTASAAELDAAAREGLARDMDRWLAAGHDGVVLKTCHRVELYGIGDRPDLFGPGLRSGDIAAQHLLRVAAGLESVITGEDEVLHQVREALRLALQDRGTLDSRLRRLFEVAIATGRRARSGRTLSSGNLAQVAAAWLGEKTTLSGRNVLVAGAGRMGSALAHSLAGAGARITIASRDPDRASRLAAVYGGEGMNLLAGARSAKRMAGIAVALGGPWSELAMVAGRLPPTADISAPQAVPDAVRARLNGGFRGIDDLYRKSDQPPGAYIKDAEALIALQLDEYAGRISGQAVGRSPHATLGPLAGALKSGPRWTFTYQPPAGTE